MQKLLLTSIILLFLSSMVLSQETVSILEIRSEPTGAQIFIDDVLSGSTPHVITDITTGEHQIKLSRDGYEDWISTVKIEVTDTNKVYAILNTRKGQIQVNCDLKKAYIYLDGQFIGYSPRLIRDVEFGQHFLEIRKTRPSRDNEDDLSFQTTLEITDTNVILVNAILESAWLTIDSNPSGNDLFVDGFFAGTLPLEKKEMETGSHEIEIKREGYKSVYLDLDFNPGEYKTMNIDLVPMTYNKIFYRSIIFPGLGHFYAERTSIGYLYSISEICAIGGAIYMNSQMSDASQQYNDLYNRYLEAGNEDDAQKLHQEVADKYDTVQKYETLRNVFIGAAVAIWLVNIYDAHSMAKNIEEKRDTLSSILRNSNFYILTDRSECRIGLSVVF